MNLKQEIERLKQNNWLPSNFNFSDEELENIKNCINSCTSPRKEDIFNAFRGLNPNTVKVLIMGQDPYPNPNKAHGLAFSCKEGRAISLGEIFKAVNKYCKDENKNHSYNLEKWANNNGVLLLNTALTYEKHANKGKKYKSDNDKKLRKKETIQIKQKHQKFWKPFVKAIMESLFSKNKNLIVFLWGKDAKKIFDECQNNKQIRYFANCHPANRNKRSKESFFEITPIQFAQCAKFLKKDIWKEI